MSGGCRILFRPPTENAQELELSLSPDLCSPLSGPNIMPSTQLSSTPSKRAVFFMLNIWVTQYPRLGEGWDQDFVLPQVCCIGWASVGEVLILEGE